MEWQTAVWLPFGGSTAADADRYRAHRWPADLGGDVSADAIVESSDAWPTFEPRSPVR